MLLEDYKSTGSSNPIYTRLDTLSSRKISGLCIGRFLELDFYFDAAVACGYFVA